MEKKHHSMSIPCSMTERKGITADGNSYRERNRTDPPTRENSCDCDISVDYPGKGVC